MVGALAAVGVGAALVVSGPAYAAGPALRSAPVRIFKKTRDFASCEKAGAWAQANPVGTTKWVFGIDWTAPQVSKFGDTWEADSIGTPVFRSGQSSITVTIPRWKNMTSADRAAVAGFNSAVLAHEQGHIEIAEKHVAGLPKKVPLGGFGPTRAAALQDLKNVEEGWRRAVEEQIQALQDEYDTETDHGRDQHKVGGDDVVLNCPQR
ncbi:DUF922 domain-containing protein [Actinomadura kijaniata]|uniref:DUF922 domain-containing protein n=1 Tax=Actinomadura kijaniata TaxID=46161 RepID=UPI003F1CE4A8